MSRPTAKNAKTYVLSNLSGTISATRKRLETLRGSS